MRHRETALTIALAVMIAALATALAPLPAAAQSQGPNQCNKRDVVLRWAATQFDETPIGRGVTNASGLVEVLSSEDGDTWTIIVTTPAGLTCVVAFGTGWHNINSLRGQGT